MGEAVKTACSKAIIEIEQNAIRAPSEEIAAFLTYCAGVNPITRSVDSMTVRMALGIAREYAYRICMGSVFEPSLLRPYTISPLLDALIPIATEIYENYYLEERNETIEEDVLYALCKIVCHGFPNFNPQTDVNSGAWHLCSILIECGYMVVRRRALDSFVTHRHRPTTYTADVNSTFKEESIPKSITTALEFACVLPGIPSFWHLISISQPCAWVNPYETLPFNVQHSSTMYLLYDRKSDSVAMSGTWATPREGNRIHAKLQPYMRYAYLLLRRLREYAGNITVLSFAQDAIYPPKPPRGQMLTIMPHGAYLMSDSECSYYPNIYEAIDALNLFLISNPSVNTVVETPAEPNME